MVQVCNTMVPMCNMDRAVDGQQQCVQEIDYNCRVISAKNVFGTYSLDSWCFLFVMGKVGRLPLLGPLSFCSVTWAGLCSLIEDQALIDAASGRQVINWVVGTGRWYAVWWSRCWLQGWHAPINYNNYCVGESTYNDHSVIFLLSSVIPA